MLDAQGVVVRWWGKGTGVFRKREVPECRCSREQSETGAQVTVVQGVRGLAGRRKQLEFCSGHNRASEGFQTGE